MHLVAPHTAYRCGTHKTRFGCMIPLPGRPFRGINLRPNFVPPCSAALGFAQPVRPYRTHPLHPAPGTLSAPFLSQKRVFHDTTSLVPPGHQVGPQDRNGSTGMETLAKISPIITTRWDPFFWSLQFPWSIKTLRDLNYNRDLT